LETHSCWRLDRRPSVEAVISLRALAKPRIHRDRTNWSRFVMSVACGASKEVDINRWVSIQPLI